MGESDRAAADIEVETLYIGTNAMKLSLLLVLGMSACWAQTLKFEGRTVTVTEAEIEDELFPKGPASVCIDGPPRKQCYIAPKEYGRNPRAEVVAMGKGQTALLFSAESGGVSGFSIRYAMLKPGTGEELEDLLLPDVTVANQGQNTMWNVREISDAPILVTATYEWGPDESHYSPHRYTISAYVLLSSELVGERRYFLDDQYLTVRRYDLGANDDVLRSEKAEILARLRRVKAERDKSRAKK